MKAQARKTDAAAARLRAFFQRNGYIRWQNAGRLKLNGSKYKKGDEVRLVADTLAELTVIRRLLRAAGFIPGRPFPKARQYRQPVYGRKQTARFLALIGEH
jgi:hypothetical protein